MGSTGNRTPTHTHPHTHARRMAEFRLLKEMIISVAQSQLPSKVYPLVSRWLVAKKCVSGLGKCCRILARKDEGKKEHETVNLSYGWCTDKMEHFLRTAIRDQTVSSDHCPLYSWLHFFVTLLQWSISACIFFECGKDGGLRLGTEKK